MRTPITRILGTAVAAGMLTALTSAGSGAAGAANIADQARAVHQATAYVVGSLGAVTPINTVTNNAGKAIKVGKDPVAVAITPDGKTAYVANEISGTVTPIFTATNIAGKAIRVSSRPVYIAITP